MFPILKHCYNIRYCVYWLTTPGKNIIMMLALIIIHRNICQTSKWIYFHGVVDTCMFHPDSKTFHLTEVRTFAQVFITKLWFQTILKKKKLFEFSWIKGKCYELSKQNKFKERKYFNLFRSEIYWMSYIQSSLLQPSIHIVKCINLYESILNEL